MNGYLYRSKRRMNLTAEGEGDSLKTWPRLVSVRCRDVGGDGVGAVLVFIFRGCCERSCVRFSGLTTALRI